MRSILVITASLIFCAQTTAPNVPVAAPLSGKLGAPVDLLANGLTGWTWVQRPAKAGGAGATQPAMVKMKDVFTVRDGVLHDAGKPIGFIRTDAKYDNYVLTVEQRHVGKGNGGVLFAITGPDKVWPHGLECQGQTGEEGDLRGIANFPEMKTEASRTEKARVRRAGANPEKPVGEWETVEITVDHGNLTVKLNGEVENTATYPDGLLKGRIGLQAEGGEMEFRKIEIRQIEGTAQ